MQFLIIFYSSSVETVGQRSTCGSDGNAMQVMRVQTDFSVFCKQSDLHMP